MKYIILLVSALLASQCKTELALESGVPCLENNVPNEWVCVERINFDFCFPSTYRSNLYLWEKSNPHSSLSKIVFTAEDDIVSVDLNDFIVSPFPDHITLPEDNVLTERIEICDRDHTIGVFYYGKVKGGSINQFSERMSFDDQSIASNFSNSCLVNRSALNNIDSGYEGYLYLSSDDSNPKYYLSALSEMSKEGIADMIDVVKRIKRHD